MNTMTLQNEALESEIATDWTETGRGDAWDRDTPATGGIADNSDPHAVKAFRELRTELLRSTEGRPFNLALCSAIRGGGATYVAINLASTIARDRRRSAYLIDGNALNPALAERFGLGDGPGLTDHILDPAATGIDSIVYPTQRERLFVIPIGESVQSDPEFLSSPVFPELLRSIRERDERAHIIIDTPALDISADSRIAADRCHMVGLVVPYAKVTTAYLDEAVRAFDESRFAGVIFNRMPLVRGR